MWATSLIPKPPPQRGRQATIDSPFRNTGRSAFPRSELLALYEQPARLKVQAKSAQMVDRIRACGAVA